MQAKSPRALRSAREMPASARARGRGRRFPGCRAGRTALGRDSRAPPAVVRIPSRSLTRVVSGASPTLCGRSGPWVGQLSGHWATDPVHDSRARRPRCCRPARRCARRFRREAAEPSGRARTTGQTRGREGDVRDRSYDPEVLRQELDQRLDGLGKTVPGFVAQVRDRLASEPGGGAGGDEVGCREARPRSATSPRRPGGELSGTESRAGPPPRRTGSPVRSPSAGSCSGRTRGCLDGIGRRGRPRA